MPSSRPTSDQPPEDRRVLRLAPKPRAPKAADYQRALDGLRGRGTARKLKPFRLPEHPPGVGPSAEERKADPTLAMDSFSAPVFGWAQNAISSVFEEGLAFLGYPLLAEMAQRAEYRVLSESTASQMTRKWIKFRSVSGDDKGKTEKIKEITDACDKFRLRDVFYRIAVQDGFFGRSHIYVDTGDTDDREELIKPIGNGRDETSRAKISKGKLKAFRPVEAVWVYPTQYESNDPLKPDWYLPQTWFVMGKQLHATRLLTFVGREVPDLLKPAYSFGGLAMSQMAKPYVDNWLQTRQAVNDIIHKFAVYGIKTNLNVLLNAGGEQLGQRVETMTVLRDNNNIVLLDRDTEDFFIDQASLGSLDHLQAQAQEHMAAVGRIPLVELTGITPSGLNASSEGEIRVRYDFIHGFQEMFFRPHLTTCIDMIQLSEFGDIDDDITYDFVNLWELDEAAEAAVQLTKAQTHAVYVNDIGAVSHDEVRQVVGSDPESPYDGLDIEDTPAPEGEGEGEGGESEFMENPAAGRMERQAEGFGSPETGGFKAE